MIKYFFFIFLFCISNVYAYERVHIAVSSNFIEPLDLIKKQFLKKNKIIITTSKGSTAKLYAQIINNAPIDIFLSADQLTIKKIPENKIIKGTEFTYAIGKIVIFSKSRIFNPLKLKNIFIEKSSHKIVIANPKFSPYGLASKRVLESLGVWSMFENKIILASNINQVSSFIYSENADLGIISNSDKFKLKKYKFGYFEEIPQNLYTQIKQDVILLKSAEKNNNAKLFYHFLKSKDSQNIIKSFGYKITN